MKQYNFSKKDIKEIIEQAARVAHAICEKEDLQEGEKDYLISFIHIAAEVMQDVTPRKFNEAVTRTELKNAVRKINE